MNPSAHGRGSVRHIMHDLGDLAGLDLIRHDRTSVDETARPSNAAHSDPRFLNWDSFRAWIGSFRFRHSGVPTGDR